jgi:hypothetical protein
MKYRNKLQVMYFLASWLKIVSICMMSCLALSSCKLLYKPLYGYVGYTIEHLDGDSYRIEYHARAKYEYKEITVLLKRYASEICLSEYKLNKIEENYFKVTAWADVRKKPDDSKSVTAELSCEKINQKLMDKSFVSHL